MRLEVLKQNENFRNEEAFRSNANEVNKFKLVNIRKFGDLGKTEELPL